MFKLFSGEDRFPVLVALLALGIILNLLFQNLMAIQDIVVLLDEQRRMHLAAAQRELARAASHPDTEAPHDGTHTG